MAGSYNEFARIAATTINHRRARNHLGVIMCADNKRFLIILTCLFVGFFAVDALVKWARNTSQQMRLDRIEIGMPEAEVVSILGCVPHKETDGKNVFWVREHQSVFDLLFCAGSSRSGQTVEIQSGKVIGKFFVVVMI
jgi:hypothetical protein